MYLISLLHEFAVFRHDCAPILANQLILLVELKIKSFVLKELRF